MASVSCILSHVLLLMCLFIVTYHLIATKEGVMKVHGKSTKNGNMDFPWTFSPFSLKCINFEAYLSA